MDPAPDFVADLGRPFLAHRLRRASEVLLVGYSAWLPKIGVTAPPRSLSMLILLGEQEGLGVTDIAAALRRPPAPAAGRGPPDRRPCMSLRLAVLAAVLGATTLAQAQPAAPDPGPQPQMVRRVRPMPPPAFTGDGGETAMGLAGAAPTVM